MFCTPYALFFGLKASEGHMTRSSQSEEVFASGGVPIGGSMVASMRVNTAARERSGRGLTNLLTGLTDHLTLRVGRNLLTLPRLRVGRNLPTP